MQEQKATPKDIVGNPGLFYDNMIIVCITKHHLTIYVDLIVPFVIVLPCVIHFSYSVT